VILLREERLVVDYCLVGAMAGGAVANAGGGKDYPGKLTMFVLLACIVAATGGLIFGYDIGISGKSSTHHHEPSLCLFASGVLCSCDSENFLWHGSPTVVPRDRADA
jgi:hypothetical protein